MVILEDVCESKITSLYACSLHDCKAVSSQCGQGFLCTPDNVKKVIINIGKSFWCININGLPVSVSNSVPEIHWDWFFETFPLSTEQLNTVNYFLHWAVKYLNYVSRVLMDITSILIYYYFLWLVCCRRIPVHPNNRLKITLMEISVAAQVDHFCVWNSFTY